MWDADFKLVSSIVMNTFSGVMQSTPDPGAVRGVGVALDYYEGKLVLGSADNEVGALLGASGMPPGPQAQP